MTNHRDPPPALDDTPENLEAPEVAPTSPTATRRRGEDGRSARRTGRTVQFATRVSEAFDYRFRYVAKRDGLLLAQLLETTLEAYESTQKARKHTIHTGVSR